MGSQRSAAEVGESDVRVIMDRLRQIVRALRLSARAAEKSDGVTAAQLFVLQKLADSKAASLGELAGRTATDQSSVSVVVSRLVERRLVSRVGSKDDARRVEIQLTPSGRSLLQRSPQPAQVGIVRALVRLPLVKRRALARGLDALVLEMGIRQEPPMFFEEESLRQHRRGRQAHARA